MNEPNKKPRTFLRTCFPLLKFSDEKSTPIGNRAACTVVTRRYTTTCAQITTVCNCLRKNVREKNRRPRSIGRRVRIDRCYVVRDRGFSKNRFPSEIDRSEPPCGAIPRDYQLSRCGRWLASRRRNRGSSDKRRNF